MDTEMLKTFVLIAALASPASGDVETYVLDHGLSGADCVAAMVERDALAVVEVEPNRLWVSRLDVVLSCEFDA